MGHHLGKLVTILDDVGIAVTAVGMFGMAFMIAANTTLRYVFNNPWCFAEEYSGYLVVMVSFLALGYTLRKGGHITIDIVVNRLSERARTYLAITTTVITLAVTGVLLKYGLALTIDSLQHQTRSQTVMLTPLWIPQMFVVVGLFIFGLALMAYLATKVRELRNA